MPAVLKNGRWLDIAIFLPGMAFAAYCFYNAFKALNQSSHNDPYARRREQARKRACMVKEELKREVLDPNEDEELLMSRVVLPSEIDEQFIFGLDELRYEMEVKILRPVMRRVCAAVTLWTSAKGVLLHGPPGTGKTMIAKDAAKRLGESLGRPVAFLEIGASTIMSKWIGDSSRFVHATFSLARKLKPCIIFIDEVDALLGRRGGLHESEEAQQAKAEFLARWDGMGSDRNSGVLVVGATNRRAAIDAAALRRFSVQLEVALPSREQRLAILRGYLRQHAKEVPGSVALELLGLDWGALQGYLNKLRQQRGTHPQQQEGEAVVQQQEGEAVVQDVDDPTQPAAAALGSCSDMPQGHMRQQQGTVCREGNEPSGEIQAADQEHGDMQAEAASKGAAPLEGAAHREGPAGAGGASPGTSGMTEEDGVQLLKELLRAVATHDNATAAEEARGVAEKEPMRGIHNTAEIDSEEGEDEGQGGADGVEDGDGYGGYGGGVGDGEGGPSRFLERIAEETEGFSGSDLFELCREAALRMELQAEQLQPNGTKNIVDRAQSLLRRGLLQPLNARDMEVALELLKAQKAGHRA